MGIAAICLAPDVGHFQFQLDFIIFTVIDNFLYFLCYIYDASAWFLICIERIKHDIITIETFALVIDSLDEIATDCDFCVCVVVYVLR